MHGTVYRRLFAAHPDICANETPSLIMRSGISTMSVHHEDRYHSKDEGRQGFANTLSPAAQVMEYLFACA